MTINRLEHIREELDQIKAELVSLGAMRPGAINKQYRDRFKQQGIYYQLSYSHHGKSHTKHVRLGELADMTKQLATYKRFRELMERWIELAIEESELTIRQLRTMQQE